MTTYKVITPESEADTNYSKFEYMLGWYDYNGTWQQKLFTDWENATQFDNEVFNREKPTRIGAITNLETNRVILTVEDATLEDLKVYLSMFRSQTVFRIFKDGTYAKIAPDSKTLNYEQRGIRYQFSFELVATDVIELNVPV